MMVRAAPVHSRKGAACVSAMYGFGATGTMGPVGVIRQGSIPSESVRAA